MRFRISALSLLVASIFIMQLISCDMGNNKAENELSEKRRAEISKLERQIKDIDSEISLEIESKSLFHNDDGSLYKTDDPRIKALFDNSSHNEIMKGSIDARISELRSKREILVNKLTVLYKIEQEYQSKK